MRVLSESWVADTALANQSGIAWTCSASFVDGSAVSWARGTSCGVGSAISIIANTSTCSCIIGREGSTQVDALASIPESIAVAS